MISLRARDWVRLLVATVFVAVCVVGMRLPVAGPLALQTLVDPVDGFWRTARNADSLPSGEISIPGAESGQVIWDERGVPHIFADRDQDAIRAFGYVVAHDRLFQMDFLRRVTSGRLSEAMGPGLVDTDRFLRQTGMRRAVAENVAWMRREGRVDYSAAEWFADGVNAHLSSLEEDDLPFEFRLLDYRPEPWSAEDAFLIGWNLMFDLTFQREGALIMDRIRAALTEEEFDVLFRSDAPYAVPIVPPEEAHWAVTDRDAPPRRASSGFADNGPLHNERPPYAKGFVAGKGSNNWAVSGARSATGAPILAGDMHLGLTLPAIWYEVHMVTPEMNTYGVTVPGVPIPIEAFNDHLGWAFTNTGADQIDHLELELDDTRTRYRYEGGWRDLELVIDSIRVKDGASVADTVRWSHWGPVSMDGERHIATKWTGHSRIRTFEALWEMNRASSYRQFEEALRHWDVPMQNILVLAPGDTIAIRSTGYLPIRADGEGFGVRDGGLSSSEWVGRVPFDELPHVVNPVRGYLASTNQRPADPSYPYYLGRDWRAVFRSIRIDQILSGDSAHTVEDIRSYQSDVHAVQRDLFVPLIQDLGGLSERASAFRDALVAWDGSTATDRREPVLFSVWDGLLQSMTWDEAVFQRRRPVRARLHEALTGGPQAPWLDRVSTPEVEVAGDILRASLEAAADSVQLEGPPWGEVHGVLFRHLTQTNALRPLWRGPLPYPGFSETLSPGSGRRVTHSASWRVVLDGAGDRIRATGIYPGGQSGNPFSTRYDSFLEDYTSFVYYTLRRPDEPAALGGTPLSSIRITP